MTPAAILDADVLFPMLLRDTLLRVAQAGCYRPHWTDRILNEMTRNLVGKLGMEESKAEGLETLIRQAFEDALVIGWEPHEIDMPNHIKDRHVAAAAVSAGAEIIVTRNARHFRELPGGVVAMSPDDFLAYLIERQPEEVIEALTKQAASYRQPKASVMELLGWLSAALPRFAALAQSLLTSEP